MINQLPFEMNKEEDEFQKCKALTGSTATPPLFESQAPTKGFNSKFFIDLPEQEDDDEYDHINQKLNQVLLDDSHKHSLVQAFQADMSSYLSHEKLTKNSRKMQSEYSNADATNKEYVFNQYIKPNLEEHALDKYMHFVLEKILEIGLLNHKIIILDRLFNQISKMIKDLYACKVMQKGLEIMIQNPKDLNGQLQKYINFITQDNQFIKELYIDRIANQLFQKSLELFDGKPLLRLLTIFSNMILANNTDQYELCTDQYGCLIVNKIIDIYPKQYDSQIKNKANEIICRTISNSSCLIRRQYANYIMQQILEKGSEQHKRQLLDQYLLKDFVPMSMDKYGSNVAEKAIIYGGPNWRTRLWEEQVSISENVFRKLVNDQFANYPIQRLYEYLDQSTRAEFLQILHRFENNKMLNHHGQIVQKFALTNFGAKKCTQRIQQDQNKNNKQQDKNKKSKQSQQKQLQNDQSLSDITHAKSFPSAQPHQQYQQYDYQQFYMYQQMMMYQQSMMMNQQQTQGNQSTQSSSNMNNLLMQQQHQMMLQFMQDQAQQHQCYASHSYKQQ